MNKLFLVDKPTGHVTEKDVEIVYVDKNGTVYRPNDEKGIVLNENAARRLSSEIMAFNQKKTNMDWINRIISAFKEDLPNDLYNKIFDILSTVFGEQREIFIDNTLHYFIGWKDYDTALFYSPIEERRVVIKSKRISTAVFTTDEVIFIMSYRPAKDKE